MPSAMTYLQRPIIRIGPFLYRDSNQVERIFNLIKHSRQIATRYDYVAVNILAFIKLQ